MASIVDRLNSILQQGITQRNYRIRKFDHEQDRLPQRNHGTALNKGSQQFCSAAYEKAHKRFPSVMKDIGLSLTVSEI